MKNTVTIRPLQQQDIGRASEIHRDTIQSPGSAIGVPYLSQIYQSVIRDPQLGFGMVATVREGSAEHIVGVILVAYDVEQFENIRHILSNPHIVRNILSGLATGTIHLRSLLRYKDYQHAVSSLRRKPYLSIQALSVVHSMQRQGIGKTLITAVREEALKRHIPYIYVDTLTNNINGQKFYSSVGFKEIARAGDSILFVFGFNRAKKARPVT